MVISYGSISQLARSTYLSIQLSWKLAARAGLLFLRAIPVAFSQSTPSSCAPLLRARSPGNCASTVTILKGLHSMPTESTPVPTAKARAIKASEPEMLTGSGAILRSLEHLGIKDVFGLPGGAIMPFYDELMASTAV